MCEKRKFELELADGWSYIDPKRISNQLVWNTEMQLVLSHTDFAEIRSIANIGGLNCPIAVDEMLDVAYCSIPDFDEKLPSDYLLMGSTIKAISLSSGESKAIATAPEGFNFNWMLSLSEDGSKLVSYLMPNGEGINNQLAIIDIQSESMKVIPLGDTYFYPVAVSMARGKIVFTGTKSGIHLIDFAGHSLTTLWEQQDYIASVVRGASFHPLANKIAIGARGIFIWNYEQNTVERIYHSGDHAVWSMDGKYIWFNDGDEQLWRMDVENYEVIKIIELIGGSKKCSGYGRSVIQTSDGHYLLAQLTRKIRVSAEEEEKRRKEAGDQFWEEYQLFNFDHCFCLIDVENREVWQHEEYSQNISWVER